MELTLFELHFDGDTSFGPTFGGDEDDAEEALEEADTGDEVDIDWGDDEDSTGLPGPNPVAVLVGFVVLVLLGVGVKRLLGGGDEGESDEFEPEMVEIEE
ncbi:hypothetical protein [Haloarchaeobius baliensis]|uniref:hypothetical protein n=1 Tax=Haloarchaeobius baliensis TaxID=1670458 RepID=UPI003F8848D6